MTRTKKQVRAELNQRILDQLEFIEPFVDKGAYFLISNGWMAAVDINLEVAGTPTELEFTAAPNFANFKAAIEQCKDEVVITISNEREIKIASGEFEIEINCIEPERFKFASLFPKEYSFENQTNFKDSLAKALVAIKFKRKELASLSNKVFVDKTCAVASNGHLLIVSPNNENFPGSFYLKREFAEALSKSEKRLEGLGSNGVWGSFYFDDASFYHVEFAEYEQRDFYGPLRAANAPDVNSELWESLPIGLFQTIKNIKKFSDKDKVIFENNTVYTEDSKAKAIFKLDSSFDGIGFQIKYVLSIEKLCLKKIVFENKIFLFTDGHIVGALAGLDSGKHHQPQQQGKEASQRDENGIDWDDDIPF